MECNKEQKEAIMHRDGPAMVLAGPGAGKTYVITNRVKALIYRVLFVLRRNVSPAGSVPTAFVRGAA